MKSFREFRVWELAHAVTLAVYRETEAFPAHERFGLTSQMRRAASSIPMNIAEGSVRTAGEFEFSLRVALGSAAELDYQLILAHDLGYLNDGSFMALGAEVEVVKKMLVRFLVSVRRGRGIPADAVDSGTKNGLRK